MFIAICKCSGPLIWKNFTWILKQRWSSIFLCVFFPVSELFFQILPCSEALHREQKWVIEKLKEGKKGAWSTQLFFLSPFPATHRAHSPIPYLTLHPSLPCCAIPMKSPQNPRSPKSHVSHCSKKQENCCHCAYHNCIAFIAYHSGTDSAHRVPCSFIQLMSI